MKVHAVAKGVRIAPRKVIPVASLVRGRSVDDAVIILQHTPRKAAAMLSKVIQSAAANARHNLSADPTTLIIRELHIGSGPSMKRYFRVARGRAHPYLKRTTHIRVMVEAPDKPVKSVAAAEKSVAKPTAKKKAETK